MSSTYGDYFIGQSGSRDGAKWLVWGPGPAGGYALVAVAKTGRKAADIARRYAEKRAAAV